MTIFYKIKLLCVVGLLAFANSSLYAQNLVPNGSFEDHSQCPDNTQQVNYAIGWQTILNSPDYFNACSQYPVNVPDNVCGYQQAFNGAAYLGLITYAFNDLYREYVGAALMDTLDVGNSYHVTMRVSRGNWTNQAYNCAASNRLGILFTTRPVALSGPTNYAQAYMLDVVEDTLDWVLLAWHLTADSSYTRFYLGNFFDDAFTDTTVINAPLGQFGLAYYYIDSVSVVCESQNCTSGIESIGKNALHYNSLSNSITVEHPGRFALYNTLGQLLATVNRTSQFVLPACRSGWYVCVYDDGKKQQTLTFFSSQ